MLATGLNSAVYVILSHDTEGYYGASMRKIENAVPTMSSHTTQKATTVRQCVQLKTSVPTMSSWSSA